MCPRGATAPGLIGPGGDDRGSNEVVTRSVTQRIENERFCHVACLHCADHLHGLPTVRGSWHATIGPTTPLRVRRPEALSPHRGRSRHQNPPTLWVTHHSDPSAPDVRDDVRRTQDFGEAVGVGQALRELVDDVLDLERIERDIFRGRSPRESLLRVFGGQVAGQAMVAAGRTVDDDRGVHSLHGYFLRPGDPFAPIVYEVDRTRDGRSFTTRRVTAVQHGETIFTMSASFQRPEQGVEHQAPMPETPGPEGLHRRDMPPRADGPSRLDDDGQGAGLAARRPVRRPLALGRDGGARPDATGCGCAPTASCPIPTRPTAGCCTSASSPTRAT